MHKILGQVTSRIAFEGNTLIRQALSPCRRVVKREADDSSAPL